MEEKSLDQNLPYIKGWPEVSESETEGKTVTHPSLFTVFPLTDSSLIIFSLLSVL